MTGIFWKRLAINSGIRVGDIVKLTIGDVIGKNIGDKVYIIEGKTKKENYFIINKGIHKVLAEYLDTLSEIDRDEWLFKSRKRNDHLITESVNHLVKKWGNDVGIKENLGAHSLRKTFGYWNHKHYKVPITTLMKRFNHSSQSITFRYIGVDSQEVNECLMNEI